MPPEKVVFATAVEALFVRALGANLSSLARRRLREAGLDLEKPLAVSYPLDDWKTFVHVASGALYPHLTPVEAHWWMGIHFLEGYLQTFTGRIVAELAPALGPRRMLERIGQDLRSGNNFSEVELVGPSPRPPTAEPRRAYRYGDSSRATPSRRRMGSGRAFSSSSVTSRERVNRSSMSASSCLASGAS